MPRRDSFDALKIIGEGEVATKVWVDDQIAGNDGNISPDAIEGSIADGNSITNLVGENLAVTADNTLKALTNDTSGVTGSHTESGDGSTTEFTFQHSLSSKPKYVHVDPTTEEASADYWLSYDSATITIKYASAPPSGTDNLVWNWSAIKDGGIDLADLSDIDHASLSNVNPGQHRTDDNIVTSLEAWPDPLDIETTASGSGDGSYTFGKADYLSERIESPNINTMQVRLDDGEKLTWGPYRPNGAYEVWRWGILTGNSDSPSALKWELENQDTGSVIASTSAQDIRGDISNDDPIARMDHFPNRPQFNMVNNTGGTVTASAFAVTYID